MMSNIKKIYEPEYRYHMLIFIICFSHALFSAPNCLTCFLFTKHFKIESTLKTSS